MTWSLIFYGYFPTSEAARARGQELSDRYRELYPGTITLVSDRYPGERVRPGATPKILVSALVRQGSRQPWQNEPVHVKSLFIREKGTRNVFVTSGGGCDYQHAVDNCLEQARECGIISPVVDPSREPHVECAYHFQANLKVNT